MPLNFPFASAIDSAIKPFAAGASTMGDSLISALLRYRGPKGLEFSPFIQQYQDQFETQDNSFQHHVGQTLTQGPAGDKIFGTKFPFQGPLGQLLVPPGIGTAMNAMKLAQQPGIPVVEVWKK